MTQDLGASSGPGSREPSPDGLGPSGFDPSRWMAIERLADTESGDAEEDAFNIGFRDGFSEAVQYIDLLTGGDGEYRYCTNGDPERHCPDAAAMMARIVERLQA